VLKAWELSVFSVVILGCGRSAATNADVILRCDPGLDPGEPRRMAAVALASILRGSLRSHLRMTAVVFQ
jgi:hypothetical protein